MGAIDHYDNFHWRRNILILDIVHQRNKVALEASIKRGNND
jgi:hypothetical protein